MIPTEPQIRTLWETYTLPPLKRTHCQLVADVAVFLAEKMQDKGVDVHIPLLYAAALLHDIDKNVEKHAGERHPDAGVRILLEHHMDEVAQLVRTHPLHTILDKQLSPQTIEEKLLFLSDKMVKYEVITVDKRFDLWRSEEMVPEQEAILEKSYPLVKKLEQEIFSTIGMEPEEVSKNMKYSILIQST